MKKLTEYRKNRHEFKVIHREGDLAISHGKHVDYGSETWEIFFVQSHDGLTIGNTYMPPTEFCPTNTQWGIKAWTGSSEKDAWKIFEKKKK